jgi:5-methyltetrahydrofolate--homocysteine methyltransferase
MLNSARKGDQDPMPQISRLYDAILNGDDRLAAELVNEALQENTRPLDLITKWMIPAMDEAGRRFEAQDFFIPEIMLAARAMKAALDPLRPLLASSGTQPTGRVIIGTVKGDLHDIGKNMVASMLEGAGFEVLDLGIDVPAEKFIEAVTKSNAHILALSALLTIALPEMKKTMDMLEQSGIRSRVRVMVGGAPVTQNFANEIKADGYGESATSAVSIARSFMGQATQSPISD